MSQSDPLLQAYRAEEFLSTDNLDRADEAVTEIFRVMFGLEIVPLDLPDPSPSSSGFGELTAIVGFSGPMRGSCQIRVGILAAKSIASAMLGGVVIDDGNDSINDALGELCNMLAGSWKNSIPALSSRCTLSPPTVISGSDYKVYVPRSSATLSRKYQFDAHTLCLTLQCEESESE